LDFLLCQAIRLTFAQKVWPLERFAAFLESHFSYFPVDYPLPSFLDNHDMNRFLVAANDDLRSLKVALLMLYALPAVPIIYYGTEVALSQNKSIHAENAQGFDEARLPMPWAQKREVDLQNYLAKLAEMRQKYPIIHQTGWQVYQADQKMDVLVLEKMKPDTAYMIINRSSKDIEYLIEVETSGRYLDIVGNVYFQSDEDALNILLGHNSAKIIVPA
jgi:glycosidase